MKVITQHYIGTTSEWEQANPKIGKAVLAFEITKDNKLHAKVGDGLNRWKTLKYFDAENIKGLPDELQRLAYVIKHINEKNENLEAVDEEIKNIIQLVKAELVDTDEEIKNTIESVKSELEDADENIKRTIQSVKTELETSDEKLSERINLLAPEGMEDLPALFKAEADARETADNLLKQTDEAINNIITQAKREIERLQNSLNAWTGRGGELDAFNFETDKPTQQALTDYTLSQIPTISDPIEIFNGTMVTNSHNGNAWKLTNTPDTNPPIFEWADTGPALIGPVGKDIGGFVKGGDRTVDGAGIVEADLGGKARVDVLAIKNAIFNRSINLSTSSTAANPVQDTGGDLTLPVKVTVTTPSASANQTTAGERSLQAQMKILIDNIAHLFINKASLFPIGTYYTQYPLEGQSTIATMFPSSEYPKALFGGEWTEVFAGENVFFRTGNTLGTRRGQQWNSTDKKYETGTTGIEPDAERNKTGSFQIYANSGDTTGIFKETDITTGVAGSNARAKRFDLDTSLQVPTDSNNHPKNRLIKVWKKTGN